MHREGLKGKCWANVTDGEPTLMMDHSLQQLLVEASCLLGGAETKQLAPRTLMSTAVDILCFNQHLYHP